MARAFANDHLALLRRLPLVLCPSFLQQIQALDTSFPAEIASLRWQSDALQGLSASRFDLLTSPLKAISLSPSLKRADWVGRPAAFVTELTAYLWSSGQMTEFRKATADLFASVPPQVDDTHRLVVVILGQEAQVDSKSVLRKLRKQGVFLTAIQNATAPAEIRELLLKHVAQPLGAYASWYVDGGPAHPEIGGNLSGIQLLTYPGLASVRDRVLNRMQVDIASPGSGPEHLRDQLAAFTQSDARATDLTGDGVLQRFYTELFTQSSGPQIFSTSFVQWTGRELARRAKPSTLLLRYAPRQRHRGLNELLPGEKAATVDVQGSLRDAEMGAFYNWIEMKRITAPDKLTFVVWVEGHPLAVVLGPGSPAGSVCTTPMTLSKAVETFG
ncbi:hypothetical protein [Terriglobus roseus]|nr:hypothetical protein [Terriglobus roseus]